MTKYELTRELVLMQLEMNREGIEHGHIEQLSIEVKYRPHGGPPRSAQTRCLNVYDGAPQGESSKPGISSVGRASAL